MPLPRIEREFAGYESAVLPLNYKGDTLVPQTGVEPVLLSEEDFKSSAATNYATGGCFGALEGIQTPNLVLRNDGSVV